MIIRDFEKLKNLASKGEKCTAIVAAAHDAHTLEAVFKAADDGYIDYLLVGHKEAIQDLGKKVGHDIIPGTIVDSASEEDCAFKSVELIRRGKGDFIVKGMLQTADLLKEVVSKETGIRIGSAMSHIAILSIPKYHKILGFTDAGMIPSPDFENKKAILQNALSLYRFLGYECPKVGILCAVEQANSKMPETLDAEKLRRLAEDGQFGKCFVEGPISFDLATDPAAVAIKGYQSPVAGDADILLVPNISCGNAICKALYGLAGGKMAGCVVGAKVPIVVNSRGASCEEKYNSILLCAAMAIREVALS